jgi:16S rRNA (adenine1518-N6/adenine1519-N6)-dimethyltransferase
MAYYQVRKRFGQHFLRDQNIIERIITTFDPKPGEKIIEIGPGKGALTIPLLHQHHELDVVEVDRDLAKAINEKCKDLGSLKVHCVDALDFDFCQFDNKRLRIIGNLPYNISTPILFHLLKYGHCISDMFFMLQKEVVERLSAEPGCKEYGRLSVMVQSQCQVEKLFNIGPESFIPSPKVDSSVVRLRLYGSTDINMSNPEIFAQIVKLAFAQRRKTLRNSLKPLFNEDQIKNVGISPDARAEELTIDQFARLTDQYHGNKNQ